MVTLNLSKRMRYVAARARRLTKAQEGVAAVEFALILPIMFFMFMGAVELSQGVTVDRRVSQVASTVGDLVARAETSILKDQVEDITKVGSYLIAPFTSQRLKMTIRSVSSSSTSATDTKEKWRCISDNATGTPAFTCECVNVGGGGTAFTLPTGLVGINDSVVISEVQYGYQPLPTFDKFFKSAWGAGTGGVYTLKDTIYQKPRGLAAKLKLTATSTPCG